MLKDAVRASTPPCPRLPRCRARLPSPAAEMPRTTPTNGALPPQMLPSPHQRRPSFPGCRDAARPSMPDLAPWPPMTPFLPRLQGCDYPTNGNDALLPPHAARGRDPARLPHQRCPSFPRLPRCRAAFNAGSRPMASNDALPSPTAEMRPLPLPEEVVPMYLRPAPSTSSPFYENAANLLNLAPSPPYQPSPAWCLDVVPR